MAKVGIVFLFLLLLPALLPAAGTAETVVPPEGISAEVAGQWDRAIVIYKAVIAEDPSRADLWLRIADIEAHLGRTLETAEALAAAARVRKDDAALHVRVSQAYAAAKRPEEALAAIDRALQIDPDNAGYLKARAQLANWLGRADVARESYERVVALRPGDADTLLALARMKAWEGKLDEASRQYRDYVAQNPDDRSALIEYARVDAWKGDYVSSLILLDQYGNRFGESKEYFQEKARVLAWARRPSPALELTGPFIKEDPENYDVLYTRAIAQHHGNRPEDALETLKTVNRLRPESKETRDLRDFLVTPLRSQVTGGARFYADTDHLNILHTYLDGTFAASPVTKLRAGVSADFLRAPQGSGLEQVNGDERAQHVRYWIGVSHRFSPAVAVDFNIGGSEAEGDSRVPTYLFALDWQARDNLRVTFSRDYGYCLISPRTVGSGIRQGMNRLSLQWEPDIGYAVDTLVRYDTFSDSNRRWEVLLSPRKEVLRNEKLNLDVGVSLDWFGFKKDLNDGYYDPRLYQSYMLVGYGYWKFDDNNGLSVVLSGGLQKDNSQDRFDFGGSVLVDGYFGIYRDWMLRVFGIASLNGRQASGAFSAFSGGLSLTLRL